MTEMKKINIGCGFDKRPGFLNVDMDPACEPDLLIRDNNFSALPRKHFDALLAHDVLEHIPRPESLNVLLEWADLLAPGGMLELRTSNVMAIVEMIKSVRTFERHSVYTIFLYGDQAHPGEHTGFTDITLSVLLAAAGFRVEEIKETDTWLFAVSALKVLDWTALLDCPKFSDELFVRDAYIHALDREPEDLFLRGDVELASRDRRALLKKLFGSQERQLRTAQKIGF
jgi:SAM-dependent methyltransferase